MTIEMTSLRPSRDARTAGSTALPAIDARLPVSCPTAIVLSDQGALACQGASARPGRAPAPEGAASLPGAAPQSQASELASRLNWLRAGVLGANDGIVSVAGLVIGVAAANPGRSAIILTAGVAGILAGAVSMAAGEYVSVSTQSDTERAMVRRTRARLTQDPESGLDALASHYRSKGLSAATARQVAQELTRHDALAAHLEAGLGLREDDYTNPWHAALSSAIAFTLGSLLPMLAILAFPVPLQVPLTFGSVLAGLALTGWISAALGRAPVLRAVARLVVGGALAMATTWAIGALIGVAV
ncbi:VIT1/CCC1 transporter family protein [Actinomyces capricornis]|nr:VIT family protein [Actinomyces capricornis]